MWRKSTYSNPNGECLEVDDHWAKSSHSMGNGDCLEWQKSSYSMSDGQCLEIAHGILVRDTKYARRGEVSPVLRFTPSAWTAFITTIKEK